MPKTIRKTVDEEILDGLAEWRNLRPDESRWDNFVVARWLIDNRHYGLGARIVLTEMARKLARAQNRKRVRNQQNKLVREYHAAKLPVPVNGELKQTTFWAHREEMSETFAHASFEQRQKQAEGFCRSMSNDAKDVNTNNPNLKKNPVQLELDFTFVDPQAKKQRVQTVPADFGRKLTKKKPH